MGKSQRDKGARIERKIVAYLEDRGIAAERVPLSGAMGGSFAGDILLKDHNQVLEVKGRNKDGVFWRTAEKFLADNYGLVLIEDRQEPLVMLRLDDLCVLLLKHQADADNT